MQGLRLLRGNSVPGAARCLARTSRPLLARASARRRRRDPDRTWGEPYTASPPPLSESALLAGCASVLGVALAAAGLRFFQSGSAAILTSLWMEFRVDAMVSAFAAGLGFVAAFASGLVLNCASRTGVSDVLTAESPTTTGLRMGRLGRGLVAVQVALACGALLLTTTFVGRRARLDRSSSRFRVTVCSRPS